MPRRLLKRIVPAPSSLRERWFLRPFGERLNDPRLWTLQRRSVAPAFGAGLAICFVPAPVHTLLAGTVAIIWRLNIPVILGTTFLLNPFTCRGSTSASCRPSAGSVTACCRCGSRSCSAARCARWSQACSAGCWSKRCGAGGCTCATAAAGRRCWRPRQGPSCALPAARPRSRTRAPCARRAAGHGSRPRGWYRVRG